MTNLASKQGLREDQALLFSVHQSQTLALCAGSSVLLAGAAQPVAWGRWQRCLQTLNKSVLLNILIPVKETSLHLSKTQCEFSA